MKLETTRNTETGAITVIAPTFTVIVCEAGVQISIGNAAVHEWKYPPSSSVPVVPDRADTPSPRAARPNRRRGAR
jgi:hypothetical protein